MTINPKTYQAYDLIHAGTLAFARAESQGIRVDVEYAEKKKARLTKKIERLENRLYETKFYRQWQHHSKSKPNINSGTQLAYFLYNVKKLEPAKQTASGKGSTDDEALRQLNIPELNDILEIKKLQKVRDTYLDAFLREQVNGYIHPSFNLHLVRTYRSCIAKGTLILVVRDFIKHPKGIPIEEIKTGDYVYCFSHTLKPAIRKVLWTGKTGNRKVLRIHYVVKGGGGKGHLDVTPEHKIRLISGKYEQAQNLTGDFRTPEENQRLPKIRALSCKRVGDTLRFTGHLRHGNGVLESRLIYKELIDASLLDQEVVHHKNEIHLDHTPSNLKKHTAPSHSRLHSKNTICSEIS